MNTKQYLGDSVYIEYLGGGEYKLYLDNGRGEHHVIILEPSVVDNLQSFIIRAEADEY